MRKIILLFAIFATLASFAQQPTPSLVQVVGEGTVSVVPDEVVIRARAEHTGQSASSVKKLNDEVVAKVIEYLKEKGIPAKNIRTDYIRLNKEYDYNSKEYFFSANQAISIHLKDLERYEEIMSGLLNSGLNRIDGVEFKTSKEEALKSEVRKKAMLDAKKKAEEFALALGQEIGRAHQISEVESGNYQPVYKVMRMESADSAGGETIAPGEMEITVKVNVGFELN